MDTLGREKIYKKETILKQKGNCVAVPVSLWSEVSSPQSAAGSHHYFWIEPALWKSKMYK